MTPFKITRLQEWLELADVEKRKLATRTWIPLMVSESQNEGGMKEPGHRKQYTSIECLIVPLEKRGEFASAHWQGIHRSSSHSGWADEDGFISPHEYTDNDQLPIAAYPVLTQHFDTGEPRIWHLLQEIELSLGLLRRGDVWVRPIEDYLEVVRLRRDAENLPVSMEIRAEHLRDYLAARRSALLIGGFAFREATELKFDEINWKDKRASRKFEQGEWEGRVNEINTGGPPGVIVRMWRESVDPVDDVPVMPHPTREPFYPSETTEFGGGGDVLELAEGRIWWTEWIEPAEKSPRIRHDKVEAQVPFFVSNQGGPKLAGDKLHEHRGWLWFRNTVIRELLSRENTSFKWYTHDTGSIGPSCVTEIHFGLNDLHHINVAAYHMADLPEWVQQIWVAHNIPPEGGLSQELHQSQNLAAPAQTRPPELLILFAIKAIQSETAKAFGQPLFHNLPEPSVLLQKIHRFRGDSFEQTCHLAKEISRYIIEKLDQAVIDKQLSPENLKIADKKEAPLRSLKRLALLLNQLGHDGRSLTKSLAGISELRQGAAHSRSSSLEEDLVLFGLSPNSENHYGNNIQIIHSVAHGLRDIARAIQASHKDAQVGPAS